MTDFLPPMAGKRGQEIIQAWKENGVRYCPGKASKVLMKDCPGCVYALDWFDHAGVLIMPDKEKIPFIEPYHGLGPKEIKELNQFCKERGLIFSVSVFSPWYPGRTIMIKFFKKEGGRWSEV